KKDFIGMNEIIEAAKKTTEITTEELAERVSKSIRVPTYTYLKLIKHACKNNLTLSDAVRGILAPEIKKKLDDLSGVKGVSIDRLDSLHEILKDWSTPKRRKKDSKYAKYLTSPKEESYDLDLSYNIEKRPDNAFRKLIEQWIYKEYTKEDISKKMIDRYMSHLEIDLGKPSGSIVFNEKSNDLTLRIDPYGAEYSPIGFRFDDYSLFLREIEEDFRYNAMEEFDDILAKEGNVWRLLESPSHSISGDLTIRNKKIYFDSIELNEKNKDTLDELIYKKYTGGGYIDIDKSYLVQIQEAIKQDDYETAKKFSENMAMQQAYKEISMWIRHILLGICKSQVVTFTMPPVLLSVLYIAGKGDKIPELIDNYLNSR
ncbi:MAG: hypothetical protein DRH24_19565, partial [Deltaproteobacteria bacterium]